MSESAYSAGSLFADTLPNPGVSATDAMRYQEYLSNTAVQRHVNDLKAAGINPWLGLGVQGASTPSGMEDLTGMMNAMAIGSARRGSGTGSKTNWNKNDLMNNNVIYQIASLFLGSEAAASLASMAANLLGSEDGSITFGDIGDLVKDLFGAGATTGEPAAQDINPLDVKDENKDLPDLEEKTDPLVAAMIAIGGLAALGGGALKTHSAFSQRMMEFG